MNDTDKTGKLIYKQMAAIMGAVPAIGKDRDNKQQGYKFRGIDEVYNVLHSILAEHKVFPMPEVISENRGTVQTSSGKTMMHTTVTVKYTFYAEDGSNVSCVMIGEGMDMGDKSGNKAVAGAEKYAFVQVFCIPTSDPKDSENDSPEIGDPAVRAKEIAEDLKKANAKPHLDNKWKGFEAEIAKMPENIQQRLEATRALVEGELSAKYKAEQAAKEADPDKAALEQDAARGDGQGSLVPDDNPHQEP
jgi:hypothetical protein